MQTVVQGDSLDDLTAEDFQGTAHILKGHSEQSIADRIGKLLGKGANPRILSVGTHAEDRIHARSFFKHGGNVGGIVLAVGIHRDDEFATGGGKARFEGGSLSAVRDEGQDPQTRSHFPSSLQKSRGAIIRTVIDDDHFEGATE